VRPANPTSRRKLESELLRGLDIQRHAIGALIMRELHTRYGRDNIGYLWMIVEPMLLATAVASLHAKTASHGADLLPVPFALGGYCLFMIFRSVVGRAEASLHSNEPLLYHRAISIFDMLAARALLEAAATLSALTVLLLGACLLGLALPPARPLTFLAALLLMLWFSFSVGMLVCAACYFSHAVGKFIHPITYILMPISGTFFLLSWIPEPYRGWLSWFPMNQIFEMYHTGQFESVQSPYYDPVYIVGWCMALTLAGLFALRIVRRHVHLS
jgi:capsular polysaccharide transport system permease protein